MGVNVRYHHAVAPVNKGQWPSVIVCCDCQAECVTAADQRNRATERLVSVAAVILKGGGGEYRPAVEYTLTSGDAFLREVGAASKHYPNLWLVSYQAVRVWSLLGVWEGIEDGRIKLADSDYRSNQAFQGRINAYRREQRDPLRPLGGGEVNRLATPNNGYLVIEDPPCILRGRIHGSSQAVTWIDIRNHGIDSLGSVMPGIESARYLATLIARMCKLCREAGLTALKPTAGSQAMAAWRHSHLTESVHVHTDQQAEALEASAYFGGRCEAARIGVLKPPCYHVDFRSQYGWVSANCALPTGLRYYRQGGCDVLPDTDWPAACIADVGLETDEAAYPYRTPDGEVIYPVGRYRTTLCGPELSDAAAHGRIKAVHAVAVYRMGLPLRSYANALYALRCQEEREGVPGSETWVKRLIVGLPGKLGQRNHAWVDAPGVMPQAMWGEWYCEESDGQLARYRSIGGLVQRDICDGFAASSVPALAAFVTSHGRTRLLGAMRCAAWENIIYWDTDSLIVNAEGYKRLARSEYMSLKAMGYLRLVSQPGTVEIRGIKYYVEDRKVVCSGLPRGHIVDLGDGHNYARYLSPAENVRKGLRPESSVVHEVYPRYTAYNAGTVLPDGRVEPIVLDE